MIDDDVQYKLVCVISKFICFLLTRKGQPTHAAARGCCWWCAALPSNSILIGHLQDILYQTIAIAR